MKCIFMVFMFFSGMLFCSPMAQARGALFVVDVSGSMADALAGIKASIRAMVQTPSYKDVSMGLMKYDGCGPNTSHYLVPIGLNNDKKIIEQASRLSAGNMTDIAGVLRHAKRIILEIYQKEGQCQDMILFTDNCDTCNNPPDVIKALLEEINVICDKDQQKFKVDVITSTAVPQSTLEYLEIFSEMTEGELYRAGATVDQIRILKQILDKKKQQNRYKPKIIKKEEPQKKEDPKKEPKKQESPKQAPKQQGRDPSMENSGGNP